MKNCNPFLLAAVLLLTNFPLQAQLVEQVVDKAIDVAVEEIPSIVLSASDLNDPGGAIDTTMDWTAIWRSSDSLGGRRTQFGPNDWEVRPKGKRTGCICMDGTEDDNFGRGACAGHGGVRYWVYTTPEGKEMHHPTDRHFRHPNPMTTDEKAGLAANNEKEEEPGRNPFGSKNTMDSFVNLAIILASSTMVIYYIRQIRKPKKKRKKRKPGRKQTAPNVDNERGNDDPTETYL